MANKDETETLLSAMDEAAESLISLVKDTDQTIALTLRPSVGEKIKAFEALTDYMKYREKPTGNAPTKSKFQDMKERFNNGGGSNKAKGRGGRQANGSEALDADDDSAPS